MESGIVGHVGIINVAGLARRVIPERDNPSCRRRRSPVGRGADN